MKRRQSGLATLATVTGMLLVATLAALQMGRALLLEVRSARQQVAAAQAAEAAEAGLEWALAQLAAGPLDDRCEAPADGDAGAGAYASLRQRWLQTEANGAVTALPAAATCAWTGESWQCACGAAAAGEDGPSVPPIETPGLVPAFRVRAETVPGAPPGVVRLRSSGCSVADARCLASDGTAPALEARATHGVLAALASVLPNPPAAALTVRSSVVAQDALLRVVQPEGSVSGVALAAGGTVRGAGLSLVGPAGTPAGEALRASSAGIPADDRRFAAAFLAAWPERWRQQPAVVDVDCTATCDGPMLRRLAAAHPGRPLWLRGATRLSGPVGSAGAPVMLVADGPVQLEGADLTGLLWLRDGALAVQGESLLRGGMIVEGGLAVAGGGALTAVHDAVVLERIRLGAGSWARIPGGWRDE